MSESTDTLAAHPDPQEQNTASQDSAGNLLKAARESAGLHIGALAVSLKVPVKRIEALEADNWDAFADTVFVRALASSICRHLKIDSAPILERLPKVVSSSGLFDDKGINAPLMSPGFAASTSVFDQLSKTVVLLGLALLVGALVLIFFPSADHWGQMVATPTQGGEMPTPVTAVVSVSTETPEVMKQSSSSENEQPNAAVVSMPSEQASSSPQLGVKSESALTSTSKLGQLIFKARATSWVEVMDAKGETQLRRNLETGETVNVSGPEPLSVVIGRADVIEVQLRGKPFDLQAVTKSNVARFEVK